MKGLPGSINVFISRPTPRMCSIKSTSHAVRIARIITTNQPSLGDGQMKKWEDPDPCKNSEGAGDPAQIVPGLINRTRVVRSNVGISRQSGLRCNTVKLIKGSSGINAEFGKDHPLT